MNIHQYVLLLIISSFLLGCGGRPPPANLPTVYKVSGKVVDAAGKPATGGTIQLESLATQNMVALGEIKPDGTFQIRTIVDGHKLDGAVVGEQRVTYIPASTQTQEGPGPAVLKKTLNVQPQDNLDVTLQL